MSSVHEKGCFCGYEDGLSQNAIEFGMEVSIFEISMNGFIGQCLE